MTRSVRNTALSMLAGAALLGAAPALAADLAKKPAPMPAPMAPAAFDIAFGAAITTDYVFRGITQSDGDPAVQGYIEASYNMLYAGVWASSIDHVGNGTGAEIDVYGGIRPEFGKFAFDIGYVHYFFTNASADYGEIYGKMDFAATDKLTLGTDLFFAPDLSQSGFTATYIEGNAAFALTEKVSLSGAIGYQFFESGGLADYLTWNAGVAWNFFGPLTLDLRYHDSDQSVADCAANAFAANGCGSRFVATLKLDTSLSALKGKM